jgi:hypothetical protein
MCRSGLAYIFVLSILAVGCSTSTEPTPIGDAATPDRPSDAHQDSLEGPTCFWKTLTRSTLPHFRFLLTTPDGQPQSLPTSFTSVDAGSWAIHDFEGKVTSKVGNQLSVDSCVSPASCQPSVYQFTFCDPSATSCRASSSSSSPSPMEAAIPLGQLVLEDLDRLYAVVKEKHGHIDALFANAVDLADSPRSERQARGNRSCRRIPRLR